jgi:RNA polymerase sigma-70 factor, ECF subfamily
MIKKELDNYSDEELVSLSLENQSNFAILIDRYEGLLKRYIFRISNFSQEDVEDVLQDVFIKVYQNLNGFNEKLKFSSWVYRITHNQVISQYRKNKARPQLDWHVDDDFMNNLKSDLDIGKSLDDKILKTQVKKILNKMDYKYSQVLVLKFLEEKSYKEISDILKKPQGTVATLINRAKKQCKKELNKNV